MSLVVHEAYSFDSQELELFWWDDFLGDAVADEWRGIGTGSAAVVDQETGGIIRFTTGALTSNALTMDWNNIRSLLVTKRVSIESRLKLNHTTTLSIQLALYLDGNNYVRFEISGANWHIRNRDGGVGNSFDSGIALDTSYHRFRIVCELAGGNHVHYYIDSPTECANSPITTNVPDDATDYLQPYFFIRTNEDVAKSMDLDYVGVRQLI